jgi:hypothetical protein
MYVHQNFFVEIMTVHCNVSDLCVDMPDGGSNVLKHVGGSLYIPSE